jgi:hypothetical protein
MSGFSQPAMIPAYFTGGLAYRALRWGIAGQWVAGPAVKTLSGLFARQLGASTLALGGEVAAFTAAQHGVRGIFDLPVSPQVPLGKEMGGLPANLEHLTTMAGLPANQTLIEMAGLPANQTLKEMGGLPANQILKEMAGLPANQILKEMAGTAILLGSLRSFGFGAGLLGGVLQRAGLAGAATPFLLSQLGSYTGLLAAQQAEHRWLFPEIPVTGNPYIHAAVSLIQFTGFGILARQITPQGWQALENKLEQKTQRLFSEKMEQIKNGLAFPLPAPELAWQAVGNIKEGKGPVPGDPRTRGLNFMWGRRKTPAVNVSPPTSLDFCDSLPKEIRYSVKRIDDLIDSNETPFIKTMAQAKISNPETLELGVKRLRHVMETSEPESANSSYLNWIVNLGLRRIAEKKDSKALEQLFTYVTRPTSLGEIETFLARQIPRASLPEPMMGISNRFKRNSDYFETMKRLPLSDQAKETLWLLLWAQKKGREETPNYVNPHDLFIRLGGLENLTLNYPSKWQMTQTVLEKANESPLGILRLKRLYLLLREQVDVDRPAKSRAREGLLGTKLREMMNLQFETSGPLPNPLPESDAEIQMGPHSAFLGKHGPWRLVKELLPQIADLLDPAKELQRREKTQKILEEFFAKHRGEEALKKENIATAYELLAEALQGENFSAINGVKSGDLSLQMAQAIRMGEFNLEALPRSQYEDRYHQILENLAKARGESYSKKSITHEGFYFGSNRRLPELDKPLLLLSLSNPNQFSPQEYIDSYRSMLAFGIHEGGHHFEKYPTGEWNEGVQVKEEAATHIREHRWEAQMGYADNLRTFSREGLGGYVSRLVDFLEKNYRKYWEN